MKPPPFKLIRPRSSAECLDALTDQESEVKVLAGGQSLMPLLNLRLARPEVLVDINQIEGLDTLELAAGTLRIGALVRHRTLETSDVVKGALPIVSRVVAHIGHRAIRNRGTLGGSLAHGDPAAELPALMTLLGAQVGATSAERGRREIGIADLFAGPLMTTLAADELLIDVSISREAPVEAHGFFEYATRIGDFARVGALAKLRATGEEDGGVVVGFRLVLFGSELSGLHHLERTRAAGTLEPFALHDVRTDPARLRAMARELADEMLAEDLRRPEGTTVRHWAHVASDRAVADLVADLVTGVRSGAAGRGGRDA